MTDGLYLLIASADKLCFWCFFYILNKISLIDFSCLSVFVHASVCECHMISPKLVKNLEENIACETLI